jgi:hypothetical protein
MQLEPLTDWLWCLRSPIVQAYAVRQRDGFNLIDTTTAGNHTTILHALAGIDGSAADDVRVYEMLLTHGHNDRFSRRAGRADRRPDRRPAHRRAGRRRRAAPTAAAAHRVGAAALRTSHAQRPARPAGQTGPPGRRRRERAR